MYRILVLEGVVKCQNVKSCFLNLRSIGRHNKKAAPDVLPWFCRRYTLLVPTSFLAINYRTSVRASAAMIIIDYDTSVRVAAAIIIHYLRLRMAPAPARAHGALNEDNRFSKTKITLPDREGELSGGPCGR